MVPRTWPRAFAHPLWWSALGLLLLNDHVWKHGSLLPRALTGKLSDVCGLLVAPPLLALALGARGKRVPSLSVLFVGIGFAAIKTLPFFAHAFEQALALFGVHGRVWLDATDLWALAVSPIAGRLCMPAPARRAPIDTSGRALFWSRRAGLALAAFACVATSGFGSSGTSKRADAPELENGTSSPLTVIVGSTDGAGGCSLYRDDRIALLTPAAFSSPRSITLAPGKRATLPAGTTIACGAASIALPDGSENHVFWRDLKELASYVPSDDARRKARVLTIDGKSGAFKTEVGSELHAFELGGDLPESTCDDAAPAFSLEATALADAQGFLELGEVRTAQDGCIEADWFNGEGDSSADTQRLCIPDWAFPFQAGQTLSVIQKLGDAGASSLHIAQFSGSAIKLELVIWNDTSVFEGGLVKSLGARDCVGTRSDCGAYQRPALASLRGKDGTFGADSDVTIKSKTPKQTRVLIGSAHDVAWSGLECTGAEAHAGIRANVLELRTY